MTAKIKVMVKAMAMAMIIAVIAIGMLVVSFHRHGIGRRRFGQQDEGR